MCSFFFNTSGLAQLKIGINKKKGSCPRWFDFSISFEDEVLQQELEDKLGYNFKLLGKMDDLPIHQTVPPFAGNASGPRKTGDASGEGPVKWRCVFPRFLDICPINKQMTIDDHQFHQFTKNLSHQFHELMAKQFTTRKMACFFLALPAVSDSRSTGSRTLVHRIQPGVQSCTFGQQENADLPKFFRKAVSKHLRVWLSGWKSWNWARCVICGLKDPVKPPLASWNLCCFHMFLIHVSLIRRVLVLSWLVLLVPFGWIGCAAPTWVFEPHMFWADGFLNHVWKHKPQQNETLLSCAQPLFLPTVPKLSLSSPSTQLFCVTDGRPSCNRSMERGGLVEYSKLVETQPSIESFVQHWSW